MLLERDAAIAAVTTALDASRATGQLVAVFGEAGIGKSTLAQAVAGRTAASHRWLWGYCDALGTPRPLGPLLDIAADVGSRTAGALATGAARHDVFAAFLADVKDAARPTVICMEDVHWADDATLDLLHFISRRLGQTALAVVLTWRDDELAADHPLYRVLSACAPAAVHRVALQPLSVEAVGALTGGAAGAAADLHALTRGNPFFVTEVAGNPGRAVPASVRDAVLARRSRLDDRARGLLDLVAVVPSRAELALVAHALDGDLAGLDACVAGGLLRSDAEVVSFRHELARRAVADALLPPRARVCHRQVLDALLARPDRARVLARLVHHAEGCGDAERALEFGPLAARQAAAVGAHRQAVEHYQRALAHAAAAGVAEETRAALTEALAYEHYLTGDIEPAREARRAALVIWQRLGDREAIGRNTRWLSRLAWFAGDGDEAGRLADAAIAALRAGPPGVELAWACSNRAQLDMLSDDVASCLRWGGEAIALARALGAREVLCHALNNVGTARTLAGDGGGTALLQESLAIALADDLHEHAARAYTNLGSEAVENRRYAAAREALDAGLAYCADRDLDAWTTYMTAWRARLRAETGQWQGACDDAEAVLTWPRTNTVSRIAALAVIGTVRVRRGDPSADAPLQEALALARRTGEAQRVVPVLLALAERAWFAGRHDEVAALAREGLAALRGSTRACTRRALEYWRWRADGTPGSGGPDDPVARHAAGDWQGAAAWWRERGCPYEEALALLDGDVAAVTAAHDHLHGLGAAPAAEWARQRLRQLGVTQVPRGRRPSTLAHPAGLTAREAEILDLLALGLRNPQIGDRLFVSAKTVEHHVSSILAKLGVASREAAVTHARTHGWLGDRRADPGAVRSTGG